MRHFEQLSSGIKSQIYEMIEEKSKLKRSSSSNDDGDKASCGSSEPKKPKCAGVDLPKSEMGAGDEAVPDISRELGKEQSLSPFNTSDMVNITSHTLAEVFGNNTPTPVTAADINRMNRERGLEIVSMASRFEALVDSASRSPAANMERNKIWHQITDEINKKYSHLNTLTFEQCKKLCKYYKRKDPATYGITLNLNPVPEEMIPSRKSTNFEVHFDEPVDDNEILEANHIVDGICKEALTTNGVDDLSSKRSDDMPEEDIVRENDRPSNDLLEFLAQCTASTSSSTNDGLVTSVQAPITNQQKKERGQYVCRMAESFGTIFESHSRSYQVNAERNQVWKQIADMTNEKYAAELGDLTVEQTKKLYANYKRKCMMACKNAHKVNLSDDDNRRGSFNDIDSDASSSNSDLLTRLVTATAPSSAGSTRRTGSPSTKAGARDRQHSSARPESKNGISSRGNSTLSPVELLAMLADRDAEIKQLKNELLQKSVEHQLQISRVIEKMAELVKSAVNVNVQREIMSSLSGNSFSFGDTFSEKTLDDDCDL